MPQLYFRKKISGGRFTVVETDFLQYESSDKFSRILMNPPFNQNQAQDHVEKAFGMLEKGGVLVACLPASLKGKDLLSGAIHEWSKTLEDKFDGTSVRVALVKIFHKC